MAAGNDVVERFSATSGRITGVLAVIACSSFALVGVAEGQERFAPWLTAVFVLVAVLAWASMLRPALWATDSDLVMRGMFTTLHLPLAAVEEMAVRQVLAVRVGERRYVSPVVGRTWRRLVIRPKQGEGRRGEVDHATWVEERLHGLVDDARLAGGVRAGSREQAALAAGVRRSVDLAPVVATACAAGLVVLTSLL